MTNLWDQKSFFDGEKYREILRDFWKFQQKIDGKDATAAILISPKCSARAKIIAKNSGIFCGKNEIEYFAKIENLEISVKKNDGDEIQKNEILAELSGNARKLLKSERIFLNFLGRMIGISTLTKKVSQKLPKTVLLLPTRKTFWGPIEKKAVAVGGGATHRVNLETAILAKENHLFLVGGAKNAAQKIADFFKKKAKKMPKNFFWEIEIESEKEFFEVLKWAPKSARGAILCDNFSPKMLKNLLKKGEKPRNILVEASGGISEKNILEFAETGVDAISCGFLTHSAKNFDVSMRIF